MKVLITGGAGFLGLHAARHFGVKGWEIVLNDIAPYETQDYPPGTAFVTQDVRDKLGMDRLLREHKPDVVVHAAAALPLWKPKDIFTTNVDGTKVVLDSAMENGCSRVIYISSTSVYGIPDHHPLFETDQVQGVGPYGKSKIMAENICFEYQKRMCVPVVRPKSFIGPFRLGIFAILYDWVESGKQIPMIGNGKNRYQLLEVEDLCEAIFLTATLEEKKVNDVFNIGAIEFKTVREDIQEMCTYARTGARPWGTPASLVKFFLAVFEATGLSPMYKWIYGTADQDSFVSTDKAKKTLGWMPQYSNADALKRSYQWYLDNKSTITEATGVTHRIAWKQGILRVVKAFM